MTTSLEESRTNLKLHHFPTKQEELEKLNVNYKLMLKLASNVLGIERHDLRQSDLTNFIGEYCRTPKDIKFVDIEMKEFTKTTNENYKILLKAASQVTGIDVDELTKKDLINYMEDYHTIY